MVRNGDINLEQKTDCNETQIRFVKISFYDNKYIQKLYIKYRQ